MWWDINQSGRFIKFTFEPMQYKFILLFNTTGLLLYVMDGQIDRHRLSINYPLYELCLYHCTSYMTEPTLAGELLQVVANYKFYPKVDVGNAGFSLTKKK